MLRRAWFPTLMCRGYPRFLYTAATTSPAANTTVLAMRGSQALAFCVTLVATALALPLGKAFFVLSVAISGDWPTGRFSVGDWDAGGVPWGISPEGSVVLCSAEVSLFAGRSGTLCSGRLSCSDGSSEVLSGLSEINIPMPKARNMARTISRMEMLVMFSRKLDLKIS